MGYYIIIIVMTIIGSVASFYLKKSSSVSDTRNIIFNKCIYIGGGLYFLASLLNIFVLRHLDYSVVLPLTSITYIWTMIISRYKLNEIITIKKIIGIGAILIGAVCVVL